MYSVNITVTTHTHIYRIAQKGGALIFIVVLRVDITEKNMARVDD